MTAMTIHLNLPDDLAQKLKELPNVDEYVLSLLRRDLTDLTDLKEDSDEITDNDLRACEDSYDAYKRGEYLTLDQWRAERLAKRAERKISVKKDAA
jgi:hypothetical protein